MERGQGRRLPHFPYKILPRQKKKSKLFLPCKQLGAYVFASRNTYRCFLSVGNEPIWSDKLHQPTLLLSPIFLIILPSFLPSPLWQGREKEQWVNQKKLGPQPKAMSVSGDTHEVSLSCVSGLRRSLGSWRTDKNYKRVTNQPALRVCVLLLVHSPRYVYILYTLPPDYFSYHTERKKGCLCFLTTCLFS